jgi:hypothetical protein
MRYPLTIVSGFWFIENKHGNSFLDWFKNTLAIQCPYVFFGSKEAIDLVKKYRDLLSVPTVYIECEINEFYTYQYRMKMITDPIHCPSVGLNLIWNEKIFFIEKASQMNPFQSEYFSWIDAGICNYRHCQPPNKPFPDLNKLIQLPKDKFIFTSSQPYFNTHMLHNPNYHYVSGTYILHKSMIPTMIELYQKKIHQIISRDKVYTDQIILTHIFVDNPNLFYNLGNGYGKILELLY